VSKIVNWGRWFVAASMAVGGVIGTKAGIDHGDGILDALIDAAICFALIWGIFIWSRWAYGFMLVSALLWIPAMAYLIISGKADEVGLSPLAPKSILTYLTECLTLVWLFLPAVRNAYWHQEIPA
jgi:hypothetical protein